VSYFGVVVGVFKVVFGAFGPNFGVVSEMFEVVFGVLGVFGVF
jgi:hypothetical protein